MDDVIDLGEPQIQTHVRILNLRKKNVVFISSLKELVLLSFGQIFFLSPVLNSSSFILLYVLMDCLSAEASLYVVFLQEVCCRVVGEKLQFSFAAASTATADSCKYTACITPLEMQVNTLHSLKTSISQKNRLFVCFLSL